MKITNVIQCILPPTLAHGNDLQVPSNPMFLRFHQAQEGTKPTLLLPKTEFEDEQECVQKVERTLPHLGLEGPIPISD